MMMSTIRSFLVVMLAAWSAHADVGGHPTVLDGDTLEVAGERIRLHGIDAPERRQQCVVDGAAWPCGTEASLALAARIAEHRVECEETDKDRYGRIVAVCRIGESDLNAWMVAEGWALAYRRYAMDYTGQEAAAEAARRGIWRGKFVVPWEWRRGRRLADAAEQPGPQRPDCRVKGNISRSGERIDHVPGGRYYERTRIDPTRGERWFCSEREAVSAGWRGAR